MISRMLFLYVVRRTSSAKNLMWFLIKGDISAFIVSYQESSEWRIDFYLKNIKTQH